MFWALSAVQVVMMSAPATASSVEEVSVTRKPKGSRLRRSFPTAAGSTSKTRRSSMPRAARKASAWNSAWEPAPIMAMHHASVRARVLAVMAEVAAVRSAVNRVISARPAS